MFCSNCGKEIDDKACVCVHCGTTVATTKVSKSDTGSFGWAVLGFFVPLAGLLIWLFCKDSTPKNAKRAGIGALVGTIASVVLTFLVFIFYFLIIFLMIDSTVFM